MQEKDAAVFEVFKHEMLLAPRQVRVRVLERMEELLAELSPDKSYPYDYIVYRLTNTRLSEISPVTLCAEDAAQVLSGLLYDLGRTVTVEAESIGERIYTMDELAARWSVSAATVLRWRRAGLALRLLRVGGGRSKAGVRESLVAKFEVDHAKLIRRVRTRRRLTDKERYAIVEKALLGLAREEAPEKVLADLSDKFSLSEPTVTRILTTAARETAALKPLTRANISRREREAIYNEVTSGACMEDIAARHGRPAESVRRIYLRARARKLLRRPIKVIPSADFTATEAEERILAAPELTNLCPRADRITADGLPVYLKGTADMPLLDQNEEVALFRKYNYLKFCATARRTTLDVRRPDEARMNGIDGLLAQAEAVRERLVRSNLRLVAAIAKRHHGRKTSFPSLISDGNMALLDAVESFDYTRGNRFSTYAGWIIMRRFARTIPEDNYWLATIDQEILETTAKVEFDFCALKPSAIAAGIARALASLPERERVVLESRFGIGRHAQPRTLAEIGEIFGVTKERIRQIEVQALTRLKEILATTAPELLPG